MPLSTALLLILASPAATPPMSPEAEMAMTAWTVCQRQNQFVLAAGPDSAERVAEAAMQSCEMAQLLFQAAWQKQHGARARTYVRDMRENFRLTGIRDVRQLRAGAALANPIQSWSSCIGAHSIEQGPDEPPEIAADRAVDACTAQEDAVVAEAESKLGREYGPGVRQRFRNDARSGIIRLINDCRANPGSGRSECVPSKLAPM